MVMHLTPQDHEMVSAAIADAEAGTSGEILAVAADESDAYHDVALHYAVLATFLTLAWFAWRPGDLGWWWDTLFGGWNAQPAPRDLLGLLFAVTLSKFLAVLAIMRWKPLRLALTPAATKTRRVRRRAIILFKAAAERRTTGRTGVLIYLSMREHRAEIVGDEAITAVSDEQTWVAAMEKLLDGMRERRPGDGMVEAIREVGTILAANFPRKADDQNEIPDKLIEL